MRQRLWLLSLTIGCLLSTPAWAYKVKCNETQTECEVDTKRIVVGDRVGIFSEDGLIVAIGTVKKLKGRARVVHLDKKYAEVKANHELMLIKDEEAQNPGQFFKFYRKTAEKTFGTSFGLTAMGVGESFTSYDLQFFMQYKMRENFYLVPRGYYMTGKGRAASNDVFIETRNLSISSMGLIFGGAGELFSQSPLYMRIEGGIGLAKVNASLSDGSDVKNVVDGRIRPGTGPIMRFEVDALYKWNTYKLLAGAHFTRLQNSNNSGVVFGGLFDF